MQRITHKEYANQMQNWIGELPQKITREWMDQVLSANDGRADMFKRWGVCGRDLSKHDLSDLTPEYFSKLTFNSSTTFPNADKMPKGYSPSRIIEQGKNPMLGIKKLHEKGIDGSGITIATIDFGFQSERHSEYKNSNIELVDLFGDTGSHFHSDGVLSNLCGQNVGVAPKSKVIHYNTYQGAGEMVMAAQAKCLQDILRRVKGGDKIRAVNISGPMMRSKKLNDCKNDKEKYESTKAELMKPLIPILCELQELGCEVVDSERFGRDFTCCEVDTTSGQKGYKRPAGFGNAERHGEMVSFVCGGKVIPEFTSDNGYKYENDSCYSWTIPQAVGMYALALQQNPKLTWNQYAQISKMTSQMTETGVRIANPKGIIDLIRNQKNVETEKHEATCESTKYLRENVSDK